MDNAGSVLDASICGDDPDPGAVVAPTTAAEDEPDDAVDCGFPAAFTGRLLNESSPA